jgi:hypothetical protein
MISYQRRMTGSIKMEQNKTDQILEVLLARMDADKAESMAKMERLLVNNRETKAYHERMMAKMDAWLGKTEACQEATEACEERTEACLEQEKKPAPEEPKAMEEPQDVPIGETDKEAIGATEDRTRQQRLAVRHHRQRKKRARVNGGARQKFAAACGRFTRRAAPVLCKGGLWKGPAKKCCSGLKGQSKASRAGTRGLDKNNVERGTPEGRTCEKRRRTHPECNSGIRRLSKTSANKRGGRTEKLDHLEAKRTHCEATRQGLCLEIVKIAADFSIRLREPGNGLLWKCRPPPKRKR